MLKMYETDLKHWTKRIKCHEKYKLLLIDVHYNSGYLRHFNLLKLMYL